MHEVTEKGHGRIENRRIVVSNSSSIPTIQFPGLRQIFKIEREVWRNKKSEPTLEKVYGFTSLGSDKASPAILLKLNRGHWSIENKSHYIRDVTYGEDLSRNRTKAGPSVLATLRNTASSLIRLAGETSIAPALRKLGRNAAQTLRVIGLNIETNCSTA